MVRGPLMTTEFAARRTARTRFMTSLTAGSVLIPEALQRLGLTLVNAEHRQEVRQAEGLAHAVLGLEKPQRCAESLRRFQALHELAEPVAVDVVHVGEVQQDLLVAFVEQLFDEPRQQL